MFSLEIILANLKAIIFAIIALIIAIFGANYVRRGKKIDKLEGINAVHKHKDEAQLKQVAIDKDTKEKIKEVDDAKGDAVLDKLNDIDK